MGKAKNPNQQAVILQADRQAQAWSPASGLSTDDTWKDDTWIRWLTLHGCTFKDHSLGPGTTRATKFAVPRLQEWARRKDEMAKWAHTRSHQSVGLAVLQLFRIWSRRATIGLKPELCTGTSGRPCFPRPLRNIRLVHPCQNTNVRFSIAIVSWGLRPYLDRPPLLPPA